ncbi:GFA family protein [Caenispirillum bisanense]|uniref:GFA family protein n=1 Tax=Caenispirillum bisanense TaxID=414052 RepID=UPI0031CDB80E
MPATTSETPPAPDTLAGGCLCGAVRFEVTGRPLYSDWCHCRECQRSSGSAGIPWGCWPAESFRLTEGRPQCFPSSWRGHRFFCPHCGATLHMTDPTDPSNVGVPLTALDDPTAVAPGCHEWVSERPAWVRLDDGLPQYDKDVPPEARQHP